VKYVDEGLGALLK